MAKETYLFQVLISPQDSLTLGMIKPILKKLLLLL